MNKHLNALLDREQEFLKEPGWYAHYVGQDPEYPNGINIHTHGLLENFNHPDLQICVPMDFHIAHQILINLIENGIKQGKQYKPGTKTQDAIEASPKYIGMKYEVLFLEANEGNRKVLRIIFPEKDGTFNGDLTDSQLPGCTYDDHMLITAGDSRYNNETNTIKQKQMKNIDKTAVFNAAVELMKSGANTTSLDVKQHLRKNGYWATQSNVSAFLQENQQEHDWVADKSGPYVVYSLPVKTQSTNALDEAQTILDFISKIVEEYYDDEIQEEDELRDDLEMDHIDLINLSVKLDGHFSIYSRKEDWSNIYTVKDVIDLVDRLKGGNNIAATTSSSSTPGRRSRTVINDSVNPSTSARVTINIDPKVDIPLGHKYTIQDIKSTHPHDDWWVYDVSTGSMDQAAIYDKKYTSDNVRSAYARLKKQKIQDVRARRISRL